MKNRPISPEKPESISLFLLGRTAEVLVCRKPIRHIYLRVSRDKTITLSVPKRTSDARIDAFLTEKRGWLERHLAKLDRREDLGAELTLEDGAVFSFLGQKRVLKRLKAAKNQTEFFEDPFVIRLYLKDPADDALARRVFRKDCRLTLENLLRAYIKKWMPVFAERKVPFPEIRILKMRSTWGTCAYKKGVVTFSESLIRTAPASIEYVVLHELTHFLYPAHDKAFYSFLSALMPDWKARKNRLIRDK